MIILDKTKKVGESLPLLRQYILPKNAQLSRRSSKAESRLKLLVPVASCHGDGM